MNQESTEQQHDMSHQQQDSFLDNIIGYGTQRTLLAYGVYAFAGLALLFLWIPLIAVIFLSFAENATTVFPFEGFTLNHYAATFTDSSLMRAFGQSILVATPAALVATVLGVLASFGLVRYEFRYRETVRVFTILPMVIPGIIIGVALLIFYKILNLDLGYMTLVLTHSMYGIPFVVLTVTARLYSFDEALEESAKDLGADTIETFRDITLPIIFPAIGAGFMFAWIRSFEDFIRAFFVSGTMSVLTTSMYGLIKFGFAFKLNTMSTIVIATIGIGLAVAMNFGNVVRYVSSQESGNEPEP